MPAVGSGRNKPQNVLAGNYRGSLNLLGVEALDQVPPIRGGGRHGKWRQFADVGDLGHDIRSGRRRANLRNGFHNAGREDLEAAEYHALVGWREYMPIGMSLEQPD